MVNIKAAERVQGLNDSLWFPVRKLDIAPFHLSFTAVNTVVTDSTGRHGPLLVPCRHFTIHHEAVSKRRRSEQRRQRSAQ